MCIKFHSIKFLTMIIVTFAMFYKKTMLTNKKKKNLKLHTLTTILYNNHYYTKINFYYWIYF